MRRVRVTVPSCGEVQKTKYGRPRGSASVQAVARILGWSDPASAGFLQRRASHLIFK